jgi:2-oxoglutarate-Fe(II)-dependent oxygenase superfamily protein
VQPYFFDPDHLAKLAAAHAGAYRGARPFPHVVIDDFLPAAVAQQLVDEFPAPGDLPWISYDSQTERKLETLDETRLSAFTRHVISQLNGGTLLAFLQQLTGVAGLVPDPLLWGGGLHQIERGGFLEVHADFNVHPATQLHRRLNLLLYLNPGWREEWGGHLELWDADMRACEARVLPSFNRLVLFNTDRSCFHGHPHPLTCPEGKTRKSLALYYYAREPGAGGAIDPRFENTLFQKRPGPSRWRRRRN